MPIDRTTHRFACEICGDTFDSPERERAHGAAQACEQQGLEAEPLPAGTPVLASEWSGREGGRVLRVARLAGHAVGSGRHQRGEGHQVRYRLDDQERADIRPFQLRPHLPGQLNTLLVPHADTRSLGQMLARTGAHSYEYASPGLEAAAGLLGRLSGAALDGAWLGKVFAGASSNPSRAFPMLVPRSDLSEPLRAAIDVLARPIGPDELPDDAFGAGLRRVHETLRIEGDSERLTARFPNHLASAFAYALDEAQGRMGPARAFLLCHRDDLAALLRARSDAWWAGEAVRMPAHLLVPAPGTRTGAMSAVQMRALEALGDVQLEPRRTSSYAPVPEWREGAIRVLSAPPTRSNQKIPRFRPADALAGVCGHHPEIRSISIMSASERPAVPVICVASGKGGVGKSTVAAALAIGLTGAGVPATLLDLDLEGPSLPALLDLPAAQAEGERITPHLLGDGTRVFSPGQLWPGERALTWETATLEAMIHFLAGGIDLGDSKVLVVDLPPGTPPVQTLVNGTWAPAGTLLVTTGSRVAHADLRRAYAAARSPIGIVENLTRAEAVVDGQPVEVRLYDGADSAALAAELGTPFLGSLPHRPDPAALAAAPEMESLVAAATAALDAG